ncbi:MAG: flavin reductase family protein [Alcaligenaceae bacterium]|nr:flavin reductase family protein [Alcaligenaceae bacterium]
MSLRAPDFDSPAFRTALGRFATGVTIVTTTHPDSGKPLGLTVSSFNSVSLNPPLVLWSLINTSSNIQAFEKAERYIIHVLAADQLELARRFSKGTPEERFASANYSINEYGLPKLNDECCAAWFECYSRNRYHEGDHMILIGEVERCGHTHSLPLVYHAGSFDLTPQSITDKV